MSPIYPTNSFSPGYRKLDAFEEKIYGAHAQEGFVVYQSMLGGWCPTVYCYEPSPWPWQWSEEAIQNPLVQLTYGMVLAPPTFSPVVGGPVFHPNELKIACPQPTHIHPLPKWMNKTEWEDDDDETTSEEDEERSEMTFSSATSDIDWEGEEGFDGEFDIFPRFFTSLSISPDAEDLPSPFFPPSKAPTPSAPHSPDATDLPQPRFNSDPPVLKVSLPSSIRGVDSASSSWSDTLESMVSPDPEELPLPRFEICVRLGVDGLEHLEHHNNRQNKVGGKGALDYLGGQATVRAWFYQVEGRGREDLGIQRWIDWTLDKVIG